MLTKKQRIKKTIKKIKLRISSQKEKAVPVFIFGEQRSGTNMLINMFSNSAETECYDENDEEAYDNYVLKDHATISRLIDQSHAKVVIFKPITDNQNARKLLNFYTGARGIWIYRRYQDAVNSALHNWKEHNKYLYYMIFEPSKAAWRVENISPENRELVEACYKKGISDASARSLIWYIRNYQYFQQNLDKDARLILINYEQAVINPRETFEYVFDFINLKYEKKLTNITFNTSINKHPFPDIDKSVKRLCDEMYEKLERSYKQKRSYLSS